MGAERSQWLFPPNVRGKLIGWRDSGTGTSSNGLENKDPADIIGSIGSDVLAGLVGLPVPPVADSFLRRNPGNTVYEALSLDDLIALIGSGDLTTPDLYGAEGDAFYSLEGSIAATDNTFTCAAANFTAADIGKPIAIRGAGAAGSDTRPGTLVTTIASVNSTTSVELTGAATNTVASKSATTTAVNSTTNVCTAAGHTFASGNIVRVTEAQNGLAKDGLYYVFFDADTAAAAGGNTDNFKLRPLSTGISHDMTGTVNFTVKIDVEWGYGTDDTAAWQAAIAADKPIIANPNATYFATAPLGILTKSMDLNGSFVFSCYPDTIQTDGSESLFRVNGADNIVVRNGRLGYLGDFIKGQIAGIDVREGRNFTAVDIQAHGFPHAGIMLADSGNPNGIYKVIDPTITRCHLHHNRQGGLFFANTKNLKTIGNGFHFNGLLGDGGTGYGSAAKQSSYPLDTIQVGDHFNDNYRKGCDYHAGVGITVIGPVCLRNKIMGMYIEDTLITGSIIVQSPRIGEMAWYGTIASGVAGEGSAAQMFGIMVGAETGQGTSAAPTNYMIDGLVIDGFEWKSGATGPIPIFQYAGGLSFGSVRLINPTVRAGDVVSVVGGANSGNGNYFDFYIENPDFTVNSCSGVPIYYRSTKGRKKTLDGGQITLLGTPVYGGEIVNWDTSAITDNSFSSIGFKINGDPAAWAAAYDPIRIRRTSNEQVIGCIINGARWRDFDGLIFTHTRNAIPSEGIGWPIGSRVRNSSAPGPGVPIEWVRLTATIGDVLGTDWLAVTPQYVLNGNAAFDCPSLADGAGTNTTVTVTGAAVGDFAVASLSASYLGMIVTAHVTSANTVAVYIQNETGSVQDPASITLRARVFKN